MPETEKLAQAELVAEILAVPGGASIQEPASSNLSIEVHDAASIETVAQLLAAAPDNYLPLRLYGPGTQEYFWVALKPGGARPEDVATTVPAAWALRNHISIVDRVILALVDGSSELAVYLASSATAADVEEATRVLTPLARDNVFDAVRLSTPFTEYLGEPVA